MATLFVDKVDPQSGTSLEIGSSGDTITIPSGATITNSGTATGFGGITMADVYRYTATTGGASGDITSNLERVDEASAGFIGTGMSLSSGIFTFPSTGIYLILMQVAINYVNEQDNNSNVALKVTQNNYDYDSFAAAHAGSNSSSGQSRFDVFSSAIVDVTDTSNVKCKFAASSFDSQSYLEGNTDMNSTSFTFIRLGDT